MTGANMSLAPGMLALIIGCQKAENQKYVGTVVTLLEYVPKGRFLPAHLTKRVVESALGSWLVEHPDFPGDDLYLPGVALWAPQHLMPLPPLTEHEQIKEKELEYV